MPQDVRYAWPTEEEAARKWHECERPEIPYENLGHWLEKMSDLRLVRAMLDTWQMESAELFIACDDKNAQIGPDGQILGYMKMEQEYIYDEKGSLIPDPVNGGYTRRDPEPVWYRVQDWFIPLAELLVTWCDTIGPHIDVTAMVQFGHMMIFRTFPRQGDEPAPPTLSELMPAAIASQIAVERLLRWMGWAQGNASPDDSDHGGQRGNSDFPRAENSLPKLPQNTEVQALCYHLQQNREKVAKRQTSWNALTREFLRNKGVDEKHIEIRMGNLMRCARDFPHLWRDPG